MGAEDGSEEGDQLLRVLIPCHFQRLHSCQDSLLGQVVVITGDVRHKGSRLPTDNVPVGVNPFQGGEPGELACGDVDGARCCHETRG